MTTTERVVLNIVLVLLVLAWVGMVVTRIWGFKPMTAEDTNAILTAILGAFVMGGGIMAILVKRPWSGVVWMGLGGAALLLWRLVA